VREILFNFVEIRPESCHGNEVCAGNLSASIRVHIAADDGRQRPAFRHRQCPGFVPARFHPHPLIFHKCKSDGGPPQSKTLA